MTQQVVVITGCSTGIGLALAVILAKDQQKRYKVYATMRNLSKRSTLDEATSEELDSTLFVRELDVTKDDSVEAFFTNLLKETGRIDVLGVPFVEAYSASKFALEGMSECLVSIMRKFNVYVSTVQFGPVQTDIRKNMELLLKDIDLSKADETTSELMKANMRARQKLRTGNTCQTADEAAKFIIGIIQEDTPKFRYQPPKGSHDLVATKLKDTSGEEQVLSTVQRYLTE